MPLDEEVLSSPGFTLVEALCALAVLALGMATLLQAVGNAERGGARLTNDFQQRIIARSLLADERNVTRPLPGVTTGRVGAYRWRITTAPALEAWAAGAPRDPWRLYEIQYVIEGPRGAMTFRSLKLGPAQ